MAGVSERTVKRVVAWLHASGYMGTVSPGTTPLVRPAVLYGEQGPEGNEAAVYVLCVPGRAARQKRSSPRLGDDPARFGPLSWSRQGPGKSPRARETQDNAGGRWCIADRPGTGNEGERAAGAIQQRARVLARLSPRHVRHLARPYHAAGWTPADVLEALEWRPDGRRYLHTAAVRHPAAWARWRLGQWLGPDGLPLPSPSQLRAAQRRRQLAEQARRRAQHAAAEASRSQSAAARAAEARAQLAAASGRARQVISQAGALHQVLVRRTKARREACQGGPPPRDAAGARRLLLRRLDAAAVVRAQSHRAKTAQRLGDPEQASWIRAETARLAAVASRPAKASRG
jgi:hypothetical protein